MPKWNVLAVDDEPIILSIIEQLLKDEKYNVTTVDNAMFAWEMLSAPESSFNFVILDRIMPGIDGLELLRRIKADSRLKSLPVIMNPERFRRNK